jgi:hypothetical protein
MRADFFWEEQKCIILGQKIVLDGKIIFGHFVMPLLPYKTKICDYNYSLCKKIK